MSAGTSFSWPAAAAAISIVVPHCVRAEKMALRSPRVVLAASQCACSLSAILAASRIHSSPACAQSTKQGARPDAGEGWGFSQVALLSEQARGKGARGLRSRTTPRDAAFDALSRGASLRLGTRGHTWAYVGIRGRTVASCRQLVSS